MCILQVYVTQFKSLRWAKAHEQQLFHEEKEFNISLWKTDIYKPVSKFSLKIWLTIHL